uniref:U11-Eretoxin-Ek1bh_1 n=1 Tax=Eresus cinnaberinus TaxID=175337 RepID=A0A2D0PCN9_ERECI
MVSHVTSIVSLFALLLGLAECAKMSICESSPHSTVSAKIQILKCTIFGTRITTS